jgi:hypothetical protein
MRDRLMKIIPGTFVVVSVLLGMYVNENWYWFTVFVGANLFQSGITNWCLLERILYKAGVKNEGEGCRVK